MSISVYNEDVCIENHVNVKMYLNVLNYRPEDRHKRRSERVSTKMDGDMVGKYRVTHLLHLERYLQISNLFIYTSLSCPKIFTDLYLFSFHLI